MRALPATLAVALVLLAGCAQVPVGPAPQPSASPTAAPTATPVWLSEEPIFMTQGQPVDLSNTRGLPKAIVVVDSIVENAECATGSVTPELGQLVSVTVTGYRQGTTGQFDLAVYDWLTVDGAGVEHDAQATVTSGLCLDPAEQLNLAYDANGRAHGTILLDAPSALARILLRNTLVDPPVTLTIELPPR